MLFSLPATVTQVLYCLSSQPHANMSFKSTCIIYLHPTSAFSPNIYAYIYIYNFFCLDHVDNLGGISVYPVSQIKCEPCFIKSVWFVLYILLTTDEHPLPLNLGISRTHQAYSLNNMPVPPQKQRLCAYIKLNQERNSVLIYLLCGEPLPMTVLYMQTVCLSRRWVL